MAIQDTVSRGRILSQRFMPDDVTINVPGERVSDGRGGWTTSPGTTVQTKGRMRDFSGSEQVVASRMSEQVEGVVVLPYEVDVRSTYSLTIDGWDYAIKHVSVGSEAYMPHRKVFVSKT